MASKPAPKKTAKAPANKPAPAKQAAPKSASAKPVAAKPAVSARKSLHKPPVPGHEELKFTIESAFERRAALTPDEIEGSTKPIVGRVIDGLESGEVRVAEPDGHGGWKVNEWLKKAVLLYFRVNEMAVVEGRPAPFWDKVESRFAGYGRGQLPQGRRTRGARCDRAPRQLLRQGRGADAELHQHRRTWARGTMVDTWATVGSCAQVGKHCHLSWRCRHRRRTRTAAGQPDDHRGPLLHRRALGGGRRRGGRAP